MTFAAAWDERQRSWQCVLPISGQTGISVCVCQSLSNKLSNRGARFGCCAQLINRKPVSNLCVCLFGVFFSYLGPQKKCIHKVQLLSCVLWYKGRSRFLFYYKTPITLDASQKQQRNAWDGRCKYHFEQRTWSCALGPFAIAPIARLCLKRAGSFNLPWQPFANEPISTAFISYVGATER